MADELPSSPEVSREDCRICNAMGHETFHFLGKKYIFDVDLAREITSDGREPVELDEDDVRFSLYKCRIHKEHVPHVNVQYPGIIAYVWHTRKDGEVVGGHRLIDGHHRAARCLQLNVPYRAYLLTEEESRAIIKRSPETTAKKREAACASA